MRAGAAIRSRMRPKHVSIISEVRRFSFPRVWAVPRERVLRLAWVPQAAGAVGEAAKQRAGAMAAVEERRPVTWLERRSPVLARPRGSRPPLFALLPQAAWMQPGGRMGAIRPDAPSSES